MKADTNANFGQVMAVLDVLKLARRGERAHADAGKEIDVA